MKKNPATGTLRRVEASSRCQQLVWRPGEVKALFRFLDEEETGGNIPPGELSVVFLAEEEIIQLNQEFFGKTRPTDVIAFPGNPVENFAGEICVSADAAQRAAQERGLPFARELTLYLVHGWLHLAGFDDQQPADRRRMRRTEAKVLAMLEKNEKVPAFGLK